MAVTVVVIVAILLVIVYEAFTICQALCQAFQVVSHLTLTAYNNDYEKKWDKQFFKGPTTINSRIGLKNSVPKIDKQILKFICKFKGHRIVNLEKKKVTGFPLNWLEVTHYKATVNKTIWSWYKDRHKAIESPGINVTFMVN